MIEIVKSLVGNQLSLLKLELISTSGKSTAQVVFALIMVFFVCFIFLLLNLAGALALSVWLGAMYWGFLALAGVYMFILLVLMAFQNSIKRMITNKFISQAFRNHNRNQKYLT